jgi:hypothetical protein
MSSPGETLTTAHSGLKVHPPQQVLEARVVADGVEGNGKLLFLGLLFLS